MPGVKKVYYVSIQDGIIRDVKPSFSNFAVFTVKLDLGKKEELTFLLEHYNTYSFFKDNKFYKEEESKGFLKNIYDFLRLHGKGFNNPSIPRL